MILTVNDLVYINEAAKCLKHRFVAVYANALIGIDNIRDYISFTQIDTTMISNKGDWSVFIIDTRELSAFIKTITVESEFEVHNQSISTTGGSLSLNSDVRILNLASAQYTRAMQLMVSGNKVIDCKNVDEELIPLKNVKKTDGEVHIKIGEYFMTLFTGLLPIAKADKVFLTIYDNFTPDSIFIAQFEVKKKKFSTNVFVAYLKI